MNQYSPYGGFPHPQSNMTQIQGHFPPTQCVLGIFPSSLQSEACQTRIHQTVQQSDNEGEWRYSTAVPSCLLETNEHNHLLDFEVTPFRARSTYRLCNPFLRGHLFSEPSAQNLDDLMNLPLNFIVTILEALGFICIWVVFHFECFFIKSKPRRIKNYI